MKRKWFVLNTITAIAMVGMFVFVNTIAAHQEVQRKRQHRNDNSRAARGRIVVLNPVDALNNSWVDLTFGVKADVETLAKAHPIYQETRETLQKQIKEARESDEKRTAVKKLRESIKETKTKFNTNLKEILSEAQMTKLAELTKKRRTEVRKRANRVEQSRRSQREQRSQRRHR